MKWAEAFQRIDKPSLTNREAAGLIGFARALYNKHVKQQPPIFLTPFDWYPFGLTALGWAKPGDKFKIDTTHQLQPYGNVAQLRAALGAMTKDLDTAQIPFALIVDPRGTDAVFRALASDAWTAMQNLAKEGKPIGPGAPAGPSISTASSPAVPGPGVAAPAPLVMPSPSTPAARPAPRTPQEAAARLREILDNAAAAEREAKNREPVYEVQDTKPRETAPDKGGGGGVALLLILLLASRKRR
jgi:hypothetical protein